MTGNAPNRRQRRKPRRPGATLITSVSLTREQRDLALKLEKARGTDFTGLVRILLSEEAERLNVIQPKE